MAETRASPAWPPSGPPRSGARLAAMASALAVGLLVFVGLGRLDLWDPDEANYAEIAREMAISRDWIVPHSNYRPYLEKPPLIFWIEALAMRALGAGEAAARLPSALAGSSLVLGAALWARRALPPGGGAALTLVLGTSLGFLATARLGILDLPLAACVTLSLLGFERRVFAGGGRLAWLCFYGGMAGGCLAKGLLGLVLPLAPAAITCFWIRPPGLGRQLDPLRGAGAFVLLVAPWYAAVEARSPGFLGSFVLQHHLLRYLGEGIPHRQALPRLAYLPMVVAAGLPWSLAWPGALAEGWSRARRREPLSTLLTTAAVFPLAFFSLSATRLPQYALPSLPPLAILLARRLSGRRGGPGRLWIAALAAGALFVGLERGVAAPVNERRSLRPLAVEAGRRAARDEPILSYRLGRPYASVFYSARRILFVEEEVTFDQFVASPRRFWILIDEPERRGLERRHLRSFPPLASHAGRALITNRPPP